MNEDFNQKKDALKERIRAAEENKKKVNGIMQKLAAKYSIGEISYQDYYETVAKTFGKKTPQEWINYYDSYIEQCGNLLSRFDREGKLNKIKKFGILFLPLILFFVFIFAGYNIYKNISFTGLTVAVDKEEHSDNVNFEKTNSGGEVWTPKFNGILESLKASGSIEGDGRIKVYLDDTLILDSDNIEVSERVPIVGNLITGFSTEGSDEGGGDSGGSSGGESGSEGGDSGGDSGTSEGSGDSGSESGNGESGEPEGSSEGEESGGIGEEQNETTGGEETGGEEIGEEQNKSDEEKEKKEKIIKRFEDICENTCSLGVEKDSYNVKFEIEGEVLIKVDKFTYEILVEGKEEKEKEEKNETEKEIKNETEKEIKNETETAQIPEINITGPPILIEEIPEIKIEKNSFVELKLEDYFENGDEFFLLQIQNISTTSFDHTIKIQPDENFTGTREAKIIASNKFGTIESNLFNISVEEVSNLPPAIIKEIPEIKIVKNGKMEIKLEEYFFNADEFFFLQTQNISTTTYDHTIALIPDENFTGIRESKIIASNDFGNVESNIFNISVLDLNVTEALNFTFNENGNVSITLFQYKAIINKPTKWIKSVNGSDPDELKDLLVEIPKESENISIIAGEGAEEASLKVEQFEREIENSGKNEIISGVVLTGNVAFETDEKKGILTRIWEFITRGGITGRVVDENNDTNDDIIEEEDRKLVNLTDTVLATNASDVNIEYYTSGPMAIEENTPNGKRVFVSGDDKLNYTEILAFAQIPELRNVGEESQIKVLWIEQNIFVNFGTADLDGNGKIDYIEWIVPHLSNQTFQIILITKAEHLDENRTLISDIYDEVFALDGNWSETIPETHYVRVTFEQNLTSVNDITVFPRIVNGTPIIWVYEFNQSEVIASFENITSNEYNKVYLVNLGNRTQDTFDLFILNGSLEFDHIIDPTVTVSSQNGTGTNVTIVPGGNFSRLSIGSNTESLINTSNLFLYLPFDANTSNTITYDYSTRGLNGTYTNGAYQTSAGIIGGALFLDGINDFLELGTDGNIGESFSELTVSIWVKKTQADIPGMVHLLDKTGAGADTLEMFIGGNDRPQWRVYNATAAALAGNDAAFALSNTNWHHLVGTYNRSTVILYVDGAASTTTAILGGITDTTANDLNIGSRSSGTANNFSGTIDEVMILNYSFSATEVSNLFKNQSSRFFGRGEQIIKNLNVSGDATENRINITINSTMYKDSMINISIGDVSGDSYSYGSEYAFTNNFVSSIPITTPNNISLKFIFYSGNLTSKFISPTLENNITINSYTLPSGDTTSPTVNLLVPTNGSSVTTNLTYFAAHFTDNINVSNATLYIWNSTNNIIGTNFILAGNASITVNISFTLNYTGTLFWNYQAFDNSSNSAFNNSNYTLTFDQSIPYTILNSPANHSIYSTGVFNISLNSTVRDNSGTIDVFVYGIPAGKTGSFYKHGLIYQRLAVANNTEIIYNWTAPVIVPDGNTILLLHLDNRSAYGENQTYAVDFSNYGNNGSAVGNANPNVSGGYLAGGWEFPDGAGNNDEISIPHSSVFNVSSMTIAVWIYSTGGSASSAEIVSKDTTLSATNGFIFGLDYRTNTTYFDPGSNVLNSSDNNVFTRNNWTHVAVTANSTTIDFYVNGVLNKTHVGSYSVLNNTANLVVGGSNGGQPGGSGFNGTLDEFVIYNRTLAGYEIKNLYRLNPDKYFWKVNVTDSSANNNESAARELIVRGPQVIVENAINCSDLSTHVNNIDYGYTCTDAAYSTCVGLNADLNVTATGVLNLPGTCELFFNSSIGDGVRSLFVHGILNMTGANVTATNFSNKFNFSSFTFEPVPKGSQGNLSFANVIRPTNITDSMINFFRVDIENQTILLNSSDISTYTIVGSGSLNRKFRLNLTVYSGGAAVVDANVSAFNVSNSLTFSLLTGNDGSVYYNLTQYLDAGGGKSYWNNYTINFTKLGYLKNSTGLNITADTNLITGMQTFSFITVSTTETPHNIFSRVEDSTVFNNLSDATRPCRYVSTATINVTSTGKLVLESCTLEINSTSGPGQYNLFILGQLVANYSNITRRESNNYEFILDTNSSSEIRNSFISFAGISTIQGQRGLEVYSNNLTFNNNTMIGGSNANVEIFANRVELTFSQFMGISGSPSYNVYILSNDSRIVDSNLSGAGLADIILDSNTNLTVLNSNYSVHSISGASSIYRQWYADVSVNNTSGAAIANATVNFNNNTNNLVISVLTNSSGNIIKQNVTEYRANATARYYQTNYTVNVTKLGYGEEVQSLNLTRSTNLSFATLSNPMPTFTIHSLTNASSFNISQSNATLNVTVYDVNSDLVDIFIYGVNSTSTSSFYKHGLIAQIIGAPNKTQLFYNWTAPVIVPDANTTLLLHLDNRSAYGENQTYVYDFSSFGNNGTLVGNARPNRTGGYLAGGWEFDGIEQGYYLSIADASSLDVSSITIAAWIKPYSTGKDGYIVSKDSVATNGYFFRINYTSNATEFDPGSDIINSSDANLFVRNNWTHVAVTANATTVILYKNGVINKTYVSSYTFNTVNSNALRVGATSNTGVGLGSVNGFNGTLDEVAIYNRVLTATEIKDIYRLNAAKYFWKVNITDNGAGNSNESETREFTIGGNNAPTINYVEPISAVSPTENGATYVNFKFTATDTNGIGDLNGATARGNFSRVGEELRQNSSCLAISGESTSITQNYSCTIGMWYYDAVGSWNITATITDFSDSVTLNTTTAFTYNQLQAIVISPNALTWATFAQGATNQTSNNDPTLINNTGNYNPSAVRVTGFNLHGQTNTGEYIGVGNFTVDIETGGSPPAECVGTALTNGTAATITGASLNRGNNSVNDGSSGQEQFYYCITSVPSISSQTYSTTYIGGSWQISILAAVFGIRRRKKKKSTEELEEIFESALDDKDKKAIREILDVDEKLREHDVGVVELLNFAKKKKLAQLSLEIPIDIFASDISPAEALCKYLKEQKGFSYSDIATLLNRDQRTVWINYRNATKKNEQFNIKKKTINISLSILRDRRLSVLESIVHYLRTQNMKNADVARLLNKDPRNVWTLYTRAMRKLRLKE